MNVFNNYKAKTYYIQNNVTNEINYISTKVKQIYVINLKKDVVRRKYICILMKKYNLNFTLVVVDKIDNFLFNTFNRNGSLTRGEIGCCLSHLWCLQNVIVNKYENAIIFEDDIIFHKDFHTLFENVFCKGMDYDFLMLGACDFSFSSLHYKNVTNSVYRMDSSAKKVYGAHANYYSLAGAKKMFELKTNFDHFSFFDKDYWPMFEMFPKSAFICSPNLVVSDISTTNLDHEYPFFSVQENNYYQKCFLDFQFYNYHFIYLDLFVKNKDVKINDNDNYKSFITRVLQQTFFNEEKVFAIKSRLSLDFFTWKEICFLMNSST